MIDEKDPDFEDLRKKYNYKNSERRKRNLQKHLKNH